MVGACWSEASSSWQVSKCFVFCERLRWLRCLDLWSAVGDNGSTATLVNADPSSQGILDSLLSPWTFSGEWMGLAFTRTEYKLMMTLIASNWNSTALIYGRLPLVEEPTIRHPRRIWQLCSVLKRSGIVIQTVFIPSPSTLTFVSSARDRGPSLPASLEQGV
jgi:hypothetical protein